MATEHNSSFDSSGTQFAWDNTSLTLWQECPRKYLYRMVEGWRPKKKNIHLLFGGIYASALENFHKWIALGRDREDAMIDTVRLALDMSWDRDEGRPMEFDDPKKTRDALLRTIIWYLEQFADDPLKTFITAEGKPAVEYSFALPVDGDIILTGHIDRLVTYGKDILVTDNKTTGSVLNQWYFNQYTLDGQMTQYTFAGKVVYNIPVKGVVIDAAQVGSGFSSFDRGFTFRSDEQLDEWYHDSMLAIAHAREATLKREFPMNRTSCTKFASERGGRKGCEFYDICSQPERVRHAFLKTEFTQDYTWDPLKAR